LECISGAIDKKSALERYLNENGINKEKVIFVGNDLNDIEAMSYVGCAIAPYDAHARIRDKAAFVTQARGGFGVIREILDIITKK